jgi:hypothetical protein
MERKLNEFLALTEGTRTVLHYAQTFNHLCQYAGYHADNDAKKQDRFRRGLSIKLKERLNLVKANTFSELVIYGPNPGGLYYGTSCREEMEDPHWTLECSVTEVSFDSQYAVQSVAAECPTWQIGFPPASTARRV